MGKRFHNGGKVTHTEYTNEQYISAAKDLHESEGEIEIDCGALISRGDDDGAYVAAYVAAWVWVPNDHIKEKERAREVEQSDVHK